MKSLYILLIFTIGVALNAQVPDGGVNLNATTGTTYIKYGNATATTVSVSGQSFTEAIRFVTGSDIANSWDAQLNFPAVAGVNVGDVVLVAFWGRTIASGEETGETQLTVCIEEKGTWAKQLYYTIAMGSEWKEYYAPVEITQSLASTEVNYLIQLGFPDQTLELADVRYLNYFDTYSIEDMPLTQVTYPGQAPDAAWRAPAAERIMQIRKGSADIVVYDAAGQPLPEAEVRIEMKNHQFGFGTAIAASQLNSNTTYRDTLLKMFNEVVFENDLKWPQFINTDTHARINQAFDTLIANEMIIRGHNVIWPSYRFMPSFMEDLAGDPEAMRSAIDKHIDDVSSFTRGRLADWDVMNEPYSEHDVQDILGDEVMADWFKRTRRNDRAVKLYINDYSIISGGGKNTVKQDYYYQLIQDIDSWGGEIEGIGMQGHFGTELTSIEKVYEIVDRFSALGKDIKITEFDIAMEQREVQADYTRDFMTILFSHPSVKSIMTWGFWSGRHWKPTAAFYDDDWKIRPHGEMWNKMIQEEWWTDEFDATTNSQGAISFEGFLGSYTYTITYGGVVRSGSFTLDNSFQSGIPNQLVFSMDDSMPEQLVISSDQEGFLCEGESCVLSVPASEGLTYTWTLNGESIEGELAELTASLPGIYSLTASKNGISVVSESFELVVKPLPQVNMTVDGELAFCEGEGSVIFSAESDAEIELEWYRGNERISWDAASIEAGESGSYSLHASSAGCSNIIGSYDVLVGKKEDVVIEALNPLVFCEGGETMIRTIPLPGEIYTWGRGEEIIASDSWRITVDEEGSYHVFLEKDGCISSSDTLDVEVLPEPDASLTYEGSLSICEGGSVQLSVPAGDGLVFSWTKDGVVLNETTNVLQATEAGSYMAGVSNEACTIGSLPLEVVILSSDDPLCQTGIEEHVILASAWPNPFHERVKLSLEQASDGDVMVEVFNLMGKKLENRVVEPGVSEFSLEIGERGVYLLRISKGEELQFLKLISE